MSDWVPQRIKTGLITNGKFNHLQLEFITRQNAGIASVDQTY